MSILEDCSEQRQEELQVLTSIYPEVVNLDDLFTRNELKLDIPVDLDAPRAITIASSQDQTAATAFLPSLPPLLLHISLPVLYPIQQAPQIISIHATHQWLPSIAATELRQHLERMWSPGEPVLYNWTEFIKSGEILDSLPYFQGQLTACRITQHPAPNLLLPLLETYATQSQQSVFASTSYACSICLSDHKGSKCVMLSCGHTFCRSCLTDFWGSMISEGSVDQVACPDPVCVKSRSKSQTVSSSDDSAIEEELVRLLPAQDVHRWKRLKEKARLELDPSVLYCPISICQAPVPPPPATEEESGWSRLRTCPSCNFSFCSFCKRTWHGPLSLCPTSSTSSIVNEYLSHPEGSQERNTFEKHFGRKTMERMVREYQEDAESRKWMEENTMACPGCHVHVQKKEGCNHMSCFKCPTHFCYRCGDRLEPANPYKHFSTPGLSCYYKLFDHVDGSEGDVGAGGWEWL